MPRFLEGKDTQLSACKSMASKRLQMKILKPKMLIVFKIPARLFGESLSLALSPEPSKIHNHWDEIQPMGERNGNVLGLAEVTHLACGRGFSAVLHPPLRLPEFLPGSLTCSSAGSRTLAPGKCWKQAAVSAGSRSSTSSPPCPNSGSGETSPRYAAPGNRCRIKLHDLLFYDHGSK